MTKLSDLDGDPDNKGEGPRSSLENVMKFRFREATAQETNHDYARKMYFFRFSNGVKLRQWQPFLSRYKSKGRLMNLDKLQ